MKTKSFKSENKSLLEIKQVKHSIHLLGFINYSLSEVEHKF